MNVKQKQIIFTIIAILISIGLIWYSFSDLDFNKFMIALKNADYIWIIISMILGVLAYGFRAKRWILLIQPLGYEVKMKNAFWSIAFGYFLNVLIPRSGEVARGTSLYSTEDVPLDEIIGTIVSERIIDLLCLIIITILSVVLNFNLFKEFFSLGDLSFDSIMDFILGKGLIFFVIFMILIGLAFMFRKKIIKLPIIQKIIKFLRGMYVGLTSILRMKKRGEFLVLTFLVWFSYYLMTYLVVFAFPESSNFTWQEGLFLLVAGSLGMLIPASGSVAYPISMQFAFAAIYYVNGLSPDEGKLVGANYGWLLWGGQTLMVCIMGLISIFEIAKNKKPEVEK